MYLWRRLAAPSWLRDNEEALAACAGQRLTTVERPGKKAATLEVVCLSKKEADQFVRNFGGTSEKIPRDWLARCARLQSRPPLRIGGRLVVTREGGISLRSPADEGVSHLVIPAGAAFGTGEHATTAMSLRLLEEMTRGLKAGWIFADLGTGSGILALAAHTFGAGSIRAMDNDPQAISVARENARLNGIRGIRFEVGDARRWSARVKIEVLAANLFSELLIEVLPRIRANLRAHGRLILSGILRAQESSVVRALWREGFQPETIRRRGKWVALSARRRGPGRVQKPS